MTDESRIALRLRQQADGRIGFPGAVEYELLEGPDAGARLLCPPTLDGPHVNPDSRTWGDVDSVEIAKRIAEARAKGDKPKARWTYSYKLVVLDEEAYQVLQDAGYLDDPRHTGARLAIDNRAAPGS